MFRPSNGPSPLGMGLFRGLSKPAQENYQNNLINSDVKDFLLNYFSQR